MVATLIHRGFQCLGGLLKLAQPAMASDVVAQSQRLESRALIREQCQQVRGTQQPGDIPDARMRIALAFATQGLPGSLRPAGGRGLQRRIIVRNRWRVGHVASVTLTHPRGHSCQRDPDLC
jgi:hypothetical protein